MPSVADDPLRAWLRLWNGRLDLLKETVHPDFQGITPGLEPIDRTTLAGIIEAVRARYDVYKVSVEVGPVRQGDLVAGQWNTLAVGAGETSHWVGSSILRVQDDLIIEHWEISTLVKGDPFPLPGVVPSGVH